MPGFMIGGNGTGPSNVPETSRKHRFLVRLMSPLTTDLLFFAHRFDLPSVEIDRIIMHHKQDEINLPGKGRFQQAEIDFYRIHATNGDRAAKEIYGWRNSVLDLQRSSLVADSQSGSFFKRNAEVHLLDGGGNTAYKYLLYGVWPHKTTPGQLDFGDSSILDIKITLMVDKVQEVPGISDLLRTESCRLELLNPIAG